MRIKILASDSMGVRSMCTWVEVNSISILIDPSCSLGPWRDRLFPHPLEINGLFERWEKIKEYLKKSKILIFTHYHYDHHNPREPELYQGKEVFVKRLNDLNKRQLLRGERFIEVLKKMGIETKEADGEVYKKDNFEIIFSSSFPHGRSGRQGRVLSLVVREGRDSFLYTSDIQGFINDDMKKFILQFSPFFIFMDGPAFYMLPKSKREEEVKVILEDFYEIKKETANPEVLVFDHHSMRWKEWSGIYDFMRNKLKRLKIEFMCAAQYEGVEVLDYEAKRREIYERNSPFGEKKP